MGGGSSKSKTTQHTTTNVSTSTTTKMGDVGFTGAQAVDMAAVIESGAIARSEINADVLNNMILATGNAWNQLIGGAGCLVETSADIAENTIKQAPVITKEAAQAAVKAAEAVKPKEGIGTLPLTVIVGAAAALAVVVVKKG